MRKKAEPSHNVSVRVPLSIKKAADKAARDDQRTLSSLIVKALRAWLEAHRASSEPLRHVTLKKRNGLRTSLLGPFLFGSLRRRPNSEPVASPRHGTLSRFKAAIM